ncbi:transglutaminase domain-containing protein [Methanobrevibacter sp.]|uniref:transglutaminase domain-containing protein n=1 Tax=Methanobrevibacter sp. TaxID=66852 RepID=UPI00388F255F
MILGVVLFLSVGAINAEGINGTDETVALSENTTYQTENMDSGLSFFEQSESLNDNSKNHTQLISQSDNVYKDGNYSVVLKDSNSDEALADKIIAFTINEVSYGAKTNDEGVASVMMDLTPGTYAVTAYFAGDDSYENSTLTSQVKVLPTVQAKDITKYYKGSTKYTATFHDSLGNPLANMLVNVEVNGKSYSKKTSSKGVVSMDINMKPGTYEVVAYNPVTGYQLATSFKILPTIAASDLKKVAGDSKKFSAKFYKSNGKALSKQYVKFKIKGKTYKVKTNSNGKATLSLKNLKKGTYKIVSYNKDGSTRTNTIRVFKIATTKLVTDDYYYTFLPNDTKKVKIKFTTSLGDSSKSGKTIKIKVNGKSYSKKTDSNGQITFNFASIGKGLFKVEYSYAGNKFFKSSKTSDIVTVLDTTDSKLSVKGPSRLGYGSDSPLRVILTAGGVPLIKRSVTLNIDGQQYSTVTDNAGIASVPIDLEIGNYTVDYKTGSRFGVDGISGSLNISVFERDNCKLTWKSGTSFKDSSQSFKVLLTDLNGKPISGGNIELSIDGEIYYGKTKSNGYATIRAYAPYGPYKVYVEFMGNNNFLPTSTTHSVNVKVSQYGSGLNTKNTVSALSKYLKSSSHCKVNSAKIKSLVKSLTSGLTNKIDKAKAIFNYVRDYISYDYYYDTHKGSLGTLNSQSGNCVDQAHLLIAMYRTAGFHARYVHGSCTFGDGRFGHVWTQVLIGNTWIVGDPIGYGNYLGQINNWNTHTYSLHNRYLSLPF